MKRTARSVLLFLVLCTLVLLLAASPAAAKKPTFNEAVDQLIAQHYPQKVEAYLNSLGSSPLGFRLAGTAADNAAAEYIAQEFRNDGLLNVTLEPVPVDVWDVRGAAVRVNGRTLVASQFDGVPGTSPDGLDGTVVYVGNGTRQEIDAVGSVAGKILLVDSALDSWWMNYPGGEATLRGAKAVIMTYGINSSPWYQKMNSLGANDGEYQADYVPIVYISRADGDWLKSQIIAEAPDPVSVNVWSDVRVQMHTAGGVGYNVTAGIEGTTPQRVVIASHHDAHFRAGLDDTGAVAAQLTIAKAMKMSGYTPYRSIEFISTTGEEFGYTDCWYDWCIGAWYAITSTHSDWSGKVVGMINLELMARKGAPLTIGASPALAPWLRSSAKANKALLPWGYRVSSPISSWEDGWTFTCAGIPSFVFEAGGKGYDYIYHTNLETQKLVNWPYVGKIAKFTFKLEKRLDGGLLPYNLGAQADDLADTIVPHVLATADAARTPFSDLVTAIQDYQDACHAYQARRSSIPKSHVATVNAALIAQQKEWNTNLNCLDAWDYAAYPHVQVRSDAAYLDEAIAALQLPSPDKDAALAALENVGITWNGEYFSYPVYTDDLTRHAPGYALLTWAGQVDEAPHLDVMPQIVHIDAAEYATAASELTTMRDAELVELDSRYAAMTAVLNDMRTQVEAMQ
jgi:aminopeptidase YwaD